MSNIVLFMSVSLDGYVEGPNRELDWQRVDEELHWHFNETLRPMGAYLEGRVSHELMAGFWPTADQDPASPPPMVEYARIWREMKKYVFSRTVEHTDWNATTVREVTPEVIEQIKAATEGDLSLGGTTLAQTFMRQGLIDEYRIYVHPVAIGAGKPLFPPGVWLDLRLAETRTFGNGVVLLHYARA